MTDETTPAPKKRRGFATWDPAKHRAIARQGGEASRDRGTAHRWDSDEAVEAGRKGGNATARSRLYARIPAPDE